MQDPSIGPSSTALPPSAAPKYSLIAELGRGGMATAYLAAIQGPGGFNKLVVVKRLRPALASEPEFLKMFLAEARLSARIDHPNVVHTSEVGFDGEHHFIAMEFLDGQSLENVTRRVARRKAEQEANGDKADTQSVDHHDMPLKLHLHVITQMLQGLDFAHELTDFDGVPLNVVHRDVSPHNVMITYEGHVKVLDFGIAKAADSSGDTRTGVVKGKCAYMPAEQFGGKDIDRRADVFAVGIILWQALAGRKLWKDLSDAEIFQHVASGNVPTPSSVRPDVPPELEAICMKALARQPADRYATAADFQAAIDGYVAAHPELRATSKELGKFVTELFAEKRAKLKSIIEAELGRLAQGHTALMPALASTSISVAGPTAGSSDSAHSRTLTAEQMRPAGRPILLAALVVLAAAAFAVLLLRSRAPAVAGPGVVAQPQIGHVTIRVTPPTAKIYLDDAPLEGNPASATLPRNAIKHRVRGDAPGYVAKSEWIAVDGAQLTVDLSLEPEPRPEAKAAKPEPKVDPAKPATPPAPVWRPRSTPTAPTATVTAVATPVEPTPTATVTAPPKSSGAANLDRNDPWSKK